MNLLIIGALPPPRGGVTTHVERLIPYLEKEGIEYIVWDYSKYSKVNKRVVSLRWEPLNLIRSFLRIKGVKVSHCLISRVFFSRVMFCFFLKLVGVRLTITFVGSPKEMIDNSPLKLFFIKTLARISNHIITVNRDLKKRLECCGISKKKISIIPAFIPSREGDFIKRPIPQDMIDFCITHKPLILTYGYGPLFYSEEDLYGFDLFIQLAAKLHIDFPQAGFAVVIPEITNETYFKKLRVKINEQRLDSSFCFVIGNQYAFVPFLKYADLFVRGTNTDGDALTLREALYYGVTSIASDVCYRPEGTILFQNRNVNDLYRVARETLDNRSHRKRIETEQLNNAELFINIFKQTAGLKD